MKRLFLKKAMAASIAVAGLAMASYAHADINREFRLINRSGEAIMEFYASHVYDDYWHADLLGWGVVGPGNYQYVNASDGKYGCMFDLKTVMESGRVFVRHNVNVCELQRYTFN